MQRSDLSRDLSRLARIGVFLGALLVFLLLYRHVLPALWEIGSTVLPWFLPLILAWIIAVIMEPLVSFLTARRLNRTLAVLLALTLVVGGLGLLTFITVSELVSELLTLVEALPSWSEEAGHGALTVLDSLQRYLAGLNLPPQVVTSVEEGLGSLMEWLRELVVNLLNGLVSFLTTSLPNGILALILTLVAAFFLSRDRVAVKEWALGLLPETWRQRGGAIVVDLEGALLGFLKAQAFLVLLTAAQTVAGLYILGVKFAFTAGLLVGIADILPVLGPGTVLLPLAAWGIIAGNLRLGIGLLILYAIVSVVRQVLQPKVVGQGLGLHPLVALAAIYIGYRALGVSGVIIGPVAVVVFVALYRAGLFSRRS